MGNSKSNDKPLANNYNPHEWRLYSKNQYCEIIKNIRTNQEAEQYTFPLDGKLTLTKEFDIYEYRRTQTQRLVTVIHVEKEQSQYLCSGTEILKVRTQRIPYRLSDVHNLSFNEAIYVINEALVGFKAIHQTNGPVRVDENMIGFTPSGNVKVWLNQNFQKNHPEEVSELRNSGQQPLVAQKNQSDMVSQIFRQVQQHSENRQFPARFKQRIQSQKILNFFETINLIRDYCDQQRIVMPHNVKLDEYHLKSNQSKINELQRIESNHQTNQDPQNYVNNQQTIPQPQIYQNQRKSSQLQIEKRNSRQDNVVFNQVPLVLQHVNSQHHRQEATVVETPVLIKTSSIEHKQPVVLPKTLPPKPKNPLSNSGVHSSSKVNKPEVINNSALINQQQKLPGDYQQIIGFERKASTQKPQSATNLQKPVLIQRVSQHEAPVLIQRVSQHQTPVLIQKPSQNQIPNTLVRRQSSSMATTTQLKRKNSLSGSRVKINYVATDTQNIIPSQQTHIVGEVSNGVYTQPNVVNGVYTPPVITQPYNTPFTQNNQPQQNIVHQRPFVSVIPNRFTPSNTGYTQIVNNTNLLGQNFNTSNISRPVFSTNINSQSTHLQPQLQQPQLQQPFNPAPVTSGRRILAHLNQPNTQTIVSPQTFTSYHPNVELTESNVFQVGSNVRGSDYTQIVGNNFQRRFM